MKRHMPDQKKTERTTLDLKQEEKIFKDMLERPRQTQVGHVSMTSRYLNSWWNSSRTAQRNPAELDNQPTRNIFKWQATLLTHGRGQSIFTALLGDITTTVSSASTISINLNSYHHTVASEVSTLAIVHLSVTREMNNSQITSLCHQLELKYCCQWQENCYASEQMRTEKESCAMMAQRCMLKIHLINAARKAVT